MANEFVVRNALLTPYIGVSGSITAASAIARGMYVNSTLVASANNDVLVGLDINPTFTNGAFTGVSNIGLRVVGVNNTVTHQNQYLNFLYTGATPGQNTLNGGINFANQDYIEQSFNYTTTATYLRFQKVLSGTKYAWLFNDPNGNTGIGMSSKTITLYSSNIYLKQDGAISSITAVLNIITGSGENSNITISATNNYYSYSHNLILNATNAGVQNTNQLVIKSSGNVLINTASDSGQRLQVIGTSFFSQNVTIGSGTNISNGSDALTVVGYGSYTFSFNNSTGFTFPNVSLTSTYLRLNGAGTIFIGNNSFSAGADLFLHAGWYSVTSSYGKVRIGTANNSSISRETAVFDIQSEVIALGTTTYEANNKLTIGGSITAASAIARGTLINNTLVAAANNDVLVGLDINPTFTPGAFTGITNYALRVTGNAYFNSNAVTFAGTGGTNVGISTTANFLFDAVATAGNIAWYSQSVLSMIMPGGNTGLNIFPSAANENNTTAEVRVSTRKRVNGNIYQAAAATNITGGPTTGTFAATGTYGLDAINNLNGAFVSGVRIAESFTAIASNQNAAYAGFTFVSTINQSTSVGLTAITRGLYINPTLTSVVDFRAIETTIGKVVLSNTNHTATTLSVTNDNSSLATTTYGISSSATAGGGSTVYGIYGTSVSGQNGYAGYFFANGNGNANRTYIGVYGVSGNYTGNTTAIGGYFELAGSSVTNGTYIGVVSNVVNNSVGTAINRLFEGRLGGVAKFYVDTTGNGWFNGAVGIGSTTLNSTLVVNGSQSIGASYATTAAPTNGLIVQGNVGIGTNSPTVELDVVGAIKSSGRVTPANIMFGTNSQGSLMFPHSTTAASQVSNGINLTFYNYSTTSLTQGAWAFAGEQITATSGIQQGIRFQKAFAPSSGTASYSAFEFAHAINQTGGSTGITRGLYVNPSLVSAADWRSVEWSNSIGYGIYGAGTASNYVAGNFGFQQTSPTAIADFGASTTSRSSLRIRSGTAPTSPNDGDIWYDGADFYGRVGATTKSFTAGGGGGVTVSNYSPTVTAVTNVSSATIDHSSVYYISYNGEAYEVWGQVTMTPTAALTTTGFTITLPALSGGGIYPEVLSGSFTSSDGAVGRIYFGYPTDAAYFESVPPSTISRTYSFRFIYKVIPV